MDIRPHSLDAIADAGGAGCQRAENPVAEGQMRRWNRWVGGFSGSASVQLRRIRRYCVSLRALLSSPHLLERRGKRRVCLRLNHLLSSTRKSRLPIGAEMHPNDAHSCQDPRLEPSLGELLLEDPHNAAGGIRRHAVGHHRLLPDCQIRAL